jgi:3-hydroxyisobutyryl-CoA hydrolase
MASSTSPAPQIPMEQPGDEPDDVLFSTLYGVRTIELNRPKKLNSLNASMARKIIPRLREWEKSDMANIILMSGAGTKAFCAGGDVAALAQQNKGGVEGQKESTNYFALEYQLDHLIATYSKPYVAIMDGITMGGGVGLSVHAPFRIATERTVFAMPETTIGFFPDVGGSFFLSRLDGEIGTYLALTSERVLGVQAFYAGVATHYLDSSVLSSLTTRFSELTFKDCAPLQDRLNLINSTIAEFTSSLPSPDSYGNSKGDIRGDLRAAVDRCFQYNTIEEILDALKKETESRRPEAIKDWAKKTSETILTRSPTSLKVTLRQLRAGRDWTIGQTFINEHIIASRFMGHPDFVEGVSARLIKPLREPKWNPNKLDDIKTEDVDAFFQQKEGVEKLALLPSVPGKTLSDYKEYPHARLALPTEADIRQAQQELAGSGQGANENSVLQHLLQKWNAKEGVDVKVKDYFARGKARKHRE